jgi:hypothetical protein
VLVGQTRSAAFFPRGGRASGQTTVNFGLAMERKATVSTRSSMDHDPSSTSGAQLNADCQARARGIGAQRKNVNRADISSGASPLQPDSQRAFVNNPHPQLFKPAARGAGQCYSLDSLFRFNMSDGARMDELETPRKTHVFVSSFELGNPYNNFQNEDNPLVCLANAGVKVTVLNEYRPEAELAEAELFAQNMGVDAKIVTRIGAHPVRKNLTLVHPPMRQHGFVDGSWRVFFGEPKNRQSLPHPCVLPQDQREYGCMHPKLFIVRWEDGSVRVAVTSGNFGQGEWAVCAEVSCLCSNNNIAGQACIRRLLFAVMRRWDMCRLSRAVVAVRWVGSRRRRRSHMIALRTCLHST